ncbi:MAG: S1 RNA-binding domain-containing protein [Acidobacteria bacterium]|nr:S1 RNA-binding domain-containing protein [Acidobacteriota bacterium]
MNDYQLGQEVEGVVESILPFGVFLRLRDKTKAYIRRRELDLEPDLEPAQVTRVGELIRGEVIGLEKNDKCLELSRRNLLEDGWDEFLHSHREGTVIEGAISALHPHGVFVRLCPGIRGFVPLDELSESRIARPEDLFWVEDRVEAVVTRIDRGRKKVWLSIKARLQQRKQALAVFDKVGTTAEEVQDVVAAIAAAFTGEMITLEVCLLVGPILVVEDHTEMRDSLTTWLKQHGCEVEQAATLDEGLLLIGQKNFGLILVDLNLFDCDGLDLVRQARRFGSKAHICVMSTPDSLATRAAEIEREEVSEVFSKPLDLVELEHFFLRLAGGEVIKPWHAKHTPEPDQALIFPELELFEDSEEAPLQRLKKALDWVTKNLRAQSGVIFCLDPISRAISVLAQTEGGAVNQEAFYGLRESPVKDVICEGKPVIENHASSRGRARFTRLLDYLSFESCLGVPIKVHGEIQHAAFFFHREPERFQRDSLLRDAYAGAVLFSALLTEEVINKRLQTMHPMLLSGELGAGFGHEVANKISGLEIQVLNLLRKCEGQERLKLDSTRVLGLVLDMKDTVEAFQQLSRTNLPHGDSGCDLNQVLLRAETLLQPVARKEGVKINRRLAEGLPKAAGSVITLQQVFLNLMLNAVQQMAIKGGDHRSLSISSSLGEEELPVQVRFWDSGPGIHRQLWEKIFSPGVSTRGGSGLGLFIARSFVHSLGGRLSVEESFVPLGTTMLVELPAADEGGAK